MIGIKEIASYIPDMRVSNYDRKEQFSITNEFIKNKIGVESVALKEPNNTSSSLCVKAYEKLLKKINFDINELEVLVVVTQNPDYNIPHTSAIVHGKIDAPARCAAFDISLGCSGFVYALSIVQSFMESNQMKRGLLFTSDQYSDIIDKNDKNTSLIFGDAACVTFLSDDPVYAAVDFTFGTVGKSYRELLCSGKTLFMNGRAIYNFAAKIIPDKVRFILDRNKLQLEDIDAYIFHQGTKFIVDALTKRLKLDREKVAFDICEYGNTVSSSIPIILERYLPKKDHKKILISGFGVGLSWANSILQRV